MAGRHVTKWVGRAALAAVVVTVTACGTNAFGTVSAPANLSTGSSIAQITVTPDSLSFTGINQTQQLVASAVDSLGNAVSNPSITWSSSNVDVADVSTNGTVTSDGVGQATITASSGNATGSAVVVVAAPSGVSPAG